jgi:hypothetical protein
MRQLYDEMGFSVLKSNVTGKSSKGVKSARDEVKSVKQESGEVDGKKPEKDELNKMKNPFE